MPAVSFSDAAAAVGHSSRSTLYRLRDEGRLDAYLRPGGRGGAQLLELSPAGLPTLRQHLQRTLRPQISASGGRSSSRCRVDRRWGAVAADLSGALEAVGGLSLTAEEAAALAEALPAAVCEAFGWAGAAKLRELLAAAVEGLPTAGGEPLGVAPAAAAPSGDDPLSFYREWGRWEPEAGALEGEAYWQAVADWVNALGGRGPAAEPRADGSEPPEPYSWGEVCDLAHQIPDAGEAVESGFRFDLARWDAAESRVLIPDASDGCRYAAESLQLLLAAGRVPEELRATTLQALEAFKAAAG